MTFDPSRYLDLFVLETREHLLAARRIAAALHDVRGDDPRVQALFRHLHSVKGMSACMGFEAMTETADVGENLLSAVREERRKVGTRRRAVLLDVLDTLGRLLDAARLEERPCPGGSAPVESSREPGPATERTLDLTLQLRPDLPLPGARAEMLVGRLRRMGRISRCEPPLDELRSAPTPVPIRIRLETERATSRLARDLGRLDDLERFGVVPVPRFASLGERAEGAALDASRRIGRPVRVVVRGAEIELEPILSRALWSPIVHLVRNAIDHGIEPTEQRLVAGKPAEGTVTVEASRDGSLLRIAVEDDGRGFDRETAPISGSPLSGRGVGLEVVTGTVEDFGGRVIVISRPDRGTRVEMEIPIPVRRGGAP